MTAYALSNPMSLILDKPADLFTRADLIQVIEQRQIERLTFHYTALDGKLKELKLPVTNKEQAERILANGERVDGSSLFQGLVDSSLSDLYVVPVYKSAFLNPFDSASLDFICRYLTAEGELAPFTPDAVLSKAADTFSRNWGLELRALGELEFFMLQSLDSHTFKLPQQQGYHSCAPFAKSGHILDEMVRYISQITGDIKYAHNEVGYLDRVRSDIEEIKGKHAEQLEIEFLPTSVVEAADHLVLAKWLIRNVAYRQGCVVTFTPKLEEGVAGNGLHVHLELCQNGENQMIDETGALSQKARQLIGGLCQYASSLTAFGNTTSSAYLRLVPNQEAPTRVCWSDLNRSTMVRVPLGWSSEREMAGLLNPQQLEAARSVSKNQTVELRSPDGSALIHLLLAGITMAVDWGMKNGQDALALTDRLYIRGNIFRDSERLDQLPSLPHSCVESARILYKNRTFYERNGIFPASVIDYVVQLLKNENDEQMNERLADLPADDRLHETRRIMHRHLHRH